MEFTITYDTACTSQNDEVRQVKPWAGPACSSLKEKKIYIINLI